MAELPAPPSHTPRASDARSADVSGVHRPGSPEPHRGAPPDLGRFWTAANGLSLVRIGTVPFIAWLVYQGGPMTWLVGLVLFAIATDFLDGRIARWTGTVTEWGRVLDPAADKLAAAAVTLALVLRSPDVGPTLPAWFVGVVIVRDGLIAGGGVLQTRKLGYVMMSLWSGKVAVALLALTIVATLLAAPPALLTALLALTTAALLFSLACYAHRFVLVMRYGPALEVDARHRVLRRSRTAASSPPGEA